MSITKEEAKNIMKDFMSKPQTVENSPYVMTMLINLKNLGCTLREWDDYMYTGDGLDQAIVLIRELTPEVVKELVAEGVWKREQLTEEQATELLQ